MNSHQRRIERREREREQSKANKVPIYVTYDPNRPVMPTPMWALHYMGRKDTD
jgi:hypothetical protein